MKKEYNLSRIKKLAGINESIDDVEDASDEYDRNMQVEHKISVTILRVFLKVGIPVTEAENGRIKLRDNDFTSYEVYYDYGSSDAEVSVDECTVDQLIALKNSGLGSDFTLSPTSRMTIMVRFKINSSIVSGAAKLDI